MILVVAIVEGPDVYKRQAIGSLVGIIRFIKTLSLRICFKLFDDPVSIPVSYTHLDVYKRQKHGKGIQGGC